MAEKDKMLETLVTDQLGQPPARREPAEPKEPVEPRETREVLDRGRRPEEVVATPEPATPTGEPTKPRTLKIRGEDLTFDQIIARGLQGEIENALITAEKYPVIQRKYTDLLEKEKTVATPAVDPAEAQAKAIKEHQEGTLQVLAQYAPVSDHEIKFFVDNGLMEPDFVEAYPNATRSMVSILLYHLDELQKINARNEWSIEWINQQRKLRDALVTKSIYDTAIDVVIKRSDDKTDEAGKVTQGEVVFAGLKKQETREEFIKWLKEKVDPKVGAITSDFIASQWMAFIGPDLLKVAKEQAAKPETTPSNRKRAASDGSPSRSGLKETPKPSTVLDGLVDQHLGLTSET